MKKITGNILIILLALVMIMGSVVVFPKATRAIESTGIDKIDEFLSDKRFTNGAEWGNSKRPFLSSYSCMGCCAFTVDYVKYCYGYSQPRTGTPFTDVNEIRAGDVLTVGNQSNGNGHWFVCLKRDGDKLYVAEGNWQDKVRVGWNYTISGKGFAEDRRSFNTGYHYLDEGELTGKIVKTKAGDALASEKEEKPEASATPAPSSEHKHKYRYTVIRKATLHKNGKIRKVCSVCGEKHKCTIYSPKKVVAAETTETAAPATGEKGSKVKYKPDVVVKNEKGKTISSKYYTVTYKKYNKGKKVKATVVFKKRYSGKKSVKIKISGENSSGQSVNAAAQTAHESGDGTVH